ncbi:MAG: WD40 repeat domain-containing protein [Beijerinckiaceae bacterium]
MDQVDYDTSLTSHVSALEAGDHVIAAAFLGGAPVLALAEGEVLFCDSGERRKAHADATILVASSNSERLVTGGDDGRIVETRAKGEPAEIGSENGKWIDAVAVRDDGASAWSAGKTVRARDAKGGVKTFEAPTTVRGLAFMPKGYRLAMAHYNGVTLWFPNIAGAPDTLKWAGSHLDIAVSADNNFVVTSMQENALHGWRVSDKKDMRMTGYPTKTRSFSWSHDGEWLATSGADACVVWPFQSKDGPMGQAPRECGIRTPKVTRVAFHPNSHVIALGYDDGWILLCRLADGAELLVRQRPEEKQTGKIRPAISGLCWDGDGKRLLFGAENGEAGILTLPV